MIVLSRWHGLMTRRPLKREVLASVCQQHGVTTDEILSPTRASNVVLARHEAMFRMRQDGHSYPSIGRFLKRDHTTVWAGAKRAAERMESA